MKKCVLCGGNRDKGGIKKTKCEEDVAEKKKGGGGIKKRFCVGYTCGVGHGLEQFFFFFLSVSKTLNFFKKHFLANTQLF